MPTGADSRVLGEYPIEFDEPQPGPSAHTDNDDQVIYASGTVPWLPGATKVSVLYEGVARLTRHVSPNSPEAEIVFPAGGESLDGVVTVTWSREDSDGDAMVYSLLYSADGGTEWATLATRLDTTSYEVDTGKLAGSEAGLFRVIATDGVNTGRADVATPVQVPFKTPKVRIDSPADGAEFGGQQTIILHGDVRGINASIIQQAEYRWTSSLDGLLGSGVELLPSGLSVGEHVITLTAGAANGLQGTTTIRITVNATSAPTPVAPGEILEFVPDLSPTFQSAEPPPGKVGGRAFIGTVTAVGEPSISVTTHGGEVIVTIDDKTEISAPGSDRSGLDAVTAIPPARVAVLVDQASEPGGLWSDPVAALRITVIPGKATRQHRRYVILNKETPGKTLVMDSKGGITSFSTDFTGLKSGDSVVALVRSQKTADQGLKLKAFVSAKSVTDRLEKLSGQSTSIKDLLDKHLGAQKERFADTLSKAPDSLKTLVKRSGDGLDTEEKDTPQTDISPKVAITSPVIGSVASAGEIITIKVDAVDDGKVVSLEIRVNGVLEATVADVAAYTGLEYPVPAGISFVAIEVKATEEIIATNDQGTTISASVSLVLTAQQVMISETAVVDGSYSLEVGTLQGQSFAGREVHFRVNGIAVVETKAWQLGGADVNPLAILSLLGG